MSAVAGGYDDEHSGRLTIMSAVVGNHNNRGDGSDADKVVEASLAIIS
jgi:hypothetical protein